MPGETQQIPRLRPLNAIFARTFSLECRHIIACQFFVFDTKAEAMHGSFAPLVDTGAVTHAVTANFTANFPVAEFSISDQLFEFKKSGLSMREATEKLGLSRNRTIFLCLKMGIDLDRAASSREAAPSTSIGGREFNAGEVSVLRDLIIRQGCSLETAARIMTIMVHQMVQADEVLNACLQHKIEASSVRNAALKPKVIALAAAAAAQKTAVEALPFSPPPPAPASEYRPLRLRLFEIADDQCHNLAGRDEEGVTVYCGLPRFSTRQYCKACHGKLLVEPPPIKGITLKKRTPAPAPAPIAIAKLPAPKPVNRYREHALAMKARER